VKTILVDCSNTYSGGAKTHLKEIFNRIDLGPADMFYTFVGATEILNIIPDDDKRVSKITPASLSGLAIRRHLWRMFLLPWLVKRFDLVFYPGGTVTGNPRKSVTMCRNMLPFMRSEYSSYGLSVYFLKFELLRWIHRRSMNRADGVIFLSEFALEEVAKVCDFPAEETEFKHTMIPHGVTEMFRAERFAFTECAPKDDRPLRLLYVSGFEVYKHQDIVLKCAKKLRENGLNVEVVFVGGKNSVAFKRFERVQRKLDPNRTWSIVLGEVAHDEMQELYSGSDLFVFASTCENLPNILLEAMARRIPIVCSETRPMTDILGKGGVYFEPRNADSMAGAILSILRSVAIREEITQIAHERAMKYDWNDCARDTFFYIESILSS
jgi:glycosyltransferase involved in cell wall biosynthesis